jgi:AP-3 complex subunit beta
LLTRHLQLSYRCPPPAGPPLLFSSVIKNIASPSLPVKKLVYVYLLQHAEAEPDTTLLAINTIQKTLSASDPHLRALALRVMSGIRVPVISQIVSLGIKRGCADMSPFVRKAAALAIPKCWRLDPNTAPQLTDYLNQLLGDKQYFVAGAAVITFMQVCPDRIDLIHKHYRGLIRKLVDMDEWGQLATLRLMLSYGRRCFPRRTRRVLRNGSVTSKGFYDDDDSDEKDHTLEETAEVAMLDPDLELLLRHALPLLQSRNSAVVVAVTRIYLYLSPPSSSYLTSAIGPLISLLRAAVDIQQVVLYNIVQVALLHPQFFVHYTTHFLVRASDPPQISRLKLELLTLVYPHAPPHAQSLILSELTHFSRSSTASTIRDAVRAIGRCAQSTPPGSATSTRCLRLLLAQLSSTNGSLVAESLTVIRHLIQANPDAHINTVTRLATNLDSMTNPQARASVIWLVGEFAGTNNGDNIAADVLRILCRGFVNEDEDVRSQIVLLGAKVYLLYLNRVQQDQETQSQPEAQTEAGTQDSQAWAAQDSSTNNDANKSSHSQSASSTQNHAIPKLWSYLLHLVRYDTSYPLRDRARTYRALLASPTNTDLASLVLLAPKPVPSAPSPSEDRRAYMLGSASLVIGPGGSSGAGSTGDEDEMGGGVGVDGFTGYEGVPEWVEDGREPDARLRDEEAGAGATYVSTQGNGGGVGLSASERLDAQMGSSEVAMPVNGRAAGVTRAPAKEKTLDDWLAEEEGGKGNAAEEEDDDEEYDEDEEEETDAESGEESSEEDEEEEESEEDSEEDDHDERAGLMR